MGFEMAGFNIVYSNEIDEDFSRFYSEGMTSWAGNERKVSFIGDIEKIPLQDLKSKISGTFGIIGGPPCQDFSIRGARNGFEGIRGTLTYHYYEKVMALMPAFFLMENVPGLVMMDKTKHDFNSILDLFKEEYFINQTRLNALHYGTPQNRERLFVFGIRKSFIMEKTAVLPGESSGFNWPLPSHPNAEQLYNWGEPATHKVGFNPKKLSTPPPELCVESILVQHKHISLIPNAKEYFKIQDPEKTKKIKEGDTYRPSFKRLHRKKYSPTACYGNNEVHLHPFNNRRLSVREALRIQGVPDTYILTSPGKLGKKFKMIGNGVPVTLAYHIGLSISNFLNLLNNQKKQINGHLVKAKAKPRNVKNPVKRY